MKVIILSILLLSSLCYSLQAKVLFVLYDAGESYGLKPVIKIMKNNRVEFKVMVMGTARTLFSSSEYLLDINKDCNVSTLVERTDWPRTRPLSVADLKRAAICYHPNVVITGAVSTIQLQLAEYYQTQNIKVVSFVDAFTRVKPGSIVQKFKSISDYLIVPSVGVKKSLGGGERIKVLGQPSFEKWDELSHYVDKSRMAKFIKKGKILLFVGSYGTGYKKMLEGFIKAVQGISDQYQILLSLHPKSDGKLESTLIKKLKSRIILLPKKIKTYEWATISDLIICYRSTVCIQSLAMDKPVAYFELDRSNYSNFLLEKKIASKLTPISFTDKLKKSLERKKKITKTYFPKGAAAKIYNFILKISPLLH